MYIVFNPCGIFHKLNNCSIPLIFTHLIPKTPGLEIFKMRFTIFVSSKLVKILQNFTNLIFLIILTCLYSLHLRQFVRHEKGDIKTISWKARRTYSIIFMLNIKYRKSKTTFKSSLNPMFIGTPCTVFILYCANIQFICYLFQYIQFISYFWQNIQFISYISCKTSSLYPISCKIYSLYPVKY